MNTQEKFTQALELMSRRKHCDLVNDRQYANTGTFRFQRIGEFEELLTVTYQFNTGYATLSMRNRIRNSKVEFPYALPGELGSVLSTINENLEVQRYED